MAKETLDKLRQAEQQAQQTISDAKTKSEAIIENAKASKNELLKGLEDTKKANYAKVCEEAEATAANISSVTKIEIQENLKSLEDSYLKNKGQAVKAVIATIL